MTNTAQIRARLSMGINEESALAEELIAAMTRKQKLVVAGDVAGLRDAIGEEQALARKMSDLVSRRVELVQLAAEEMNLPQSTLTLSGFAAHLDETEKGDWIERVDDLRERLKKVQFLNRENQRLVAVSMHLNRELFKTLFPVAEVRPGTYSKSGKMDKGGQGKSLLDWQV